jgi:hypothetical protein
MWGIVIVGLLIALAPSYVLWQEHQIRVEMESPGGCILIPPDKVEKMVATPPVVQVGDKVKFSLPIKMTYWNQGTVIAIHPTDKCQFQVDDGIWKWWIRYPRDSVKKIEKLEKRAVTPFDRWNEGMFKQLEAWKRYLEQQKKTVPNKIVTLNV